jgi:hypothetical protein
VSVLCAEWWDIGISPREASWLIGGKTEEAMNMEKNSNSSLSLPTSNSRPSFSRLDWGLRDETSMVEPRPPENAKVGG